MKQTIPKLLLLDNGYKSQSAIIAERMIKYTKDNMYTLLTYEPIKEK